jgi:hypothetical protein
LDAWKNERSTTSCTKATSASRKEERIGEGRGGGKLLPHSSPSLALEEDEKAEEKDVVEKGWEGQVVVL